MAKRVYIEQTGCTRRLLEVAKFKKYFSSNHMRIVRRPGRADLMFLSTCAFKAEEEARALASVERLSAYRGELIVFGCLPRIAPEKFRACKNVKTLSPRELNDPAVVDRLFPGSDTRFEQVRDSHFPNSEPWTMCLFARKLSDRGVRSGRAVWQLLESGTRRMRARFRVFRPFYLSVGRGCAGKCTYCGIKPAIGPTSSVPLDTVVGRFTVGLDTGYRQFRIIGDDTGSYGKDIGRTLPELLRAILDVLDRRGGPGGATKRGAPGIGLHIEELNPKWVVEYESDLLALFRSKFIRSALCPIESGSDRILELMGREYSIQRVLPILISMERNNKALELNSQVIVGFPGETDDDFECTLRILAEAGFGYVVLFPYADKENTVASRMPDKVPETVVQARMKEATRRLSPLGTRVYFRCPT